jgi:hypothetical protein
VRLHQSRSLVIPNASEAGSVHQAQRPVLDEGAAVHIDPWPDPGTVRTNPDVYFEASALLEGEQKFTLPSVDSEQAVASKSFSSSSLPLVLPPPNMLKCDLKPEGAEPERHDAAQRPARLKPPDHTAEDSDDAGPGRGGVATESSCQL